MINIKNKTIGEVFSEATNLWPHSPLFVTPKTNVSEKRVFSFLNFEEAVQFYQNNFKEAGYKCGERVALLLGNDAEHYIIKIALNNLGLSVVPLNYDLTANEIIYILKDSNSVLIVTNFKYKNQILDITKELPHKVPYVYIEEFSRNLPHKKMTRLGKQPSHISEASLIYTSGTTGHPKGCILSHEYELMCGESYTMIGPPIALKVNKEKIFNPLPSFHINAGILTFFACVLTGNCLIQPPRFSLKSWWREIVETEATIFHYLGVIIAVLLKRLKMESLDLGRLRAGLGAGVEPALHEKFEKIYGIPLIEVWGMTEMCRILVANEEPRFINTRAIGKPRKGLEIKIVDEKDEEVSKGVTGEMLIRHSRATPRKGAFSGYLGKETETQYAWRGGWFHTGDIVKMDANNMIYFVDRNKNIIRRSGENIAAAEIENCLLEHDLVTGVACMAVRDEIREEEVLACVILSENKVDQLTSAKKLFNYVHNKLAYFKAPGWILFVDELPVTKTQKVIKHKIFPDNENPLKRNDIIDLRKLKKQKN